MLRYVLRSSFAAAIVLLIASQLRAEVTYTESDNNSPTVIRMVVTPAAEPSPSLKYRLLAREIDLQPGNAAPYYYRAIMDASTGTSHIRKKYGEDYDKWYTIAGGGTPMEKLPLDKLSDIDKTFDGYIQREVATATNRQYCDWQLGLEQIRGPSVISFMLPEFQGCREIGRFISLRTRLQTARRQYVDAVASTRMQLRLAHDTAQPPLLVCGLIGIAIDGMAVSALTELIASPDSPNLYWSLTQLPQPLIDLRPAAAYEIDFGPRMFPMIYNAETTDRAPQEWNRQLVESFRELRKIGMPAPLLTGTSGERDFIPALSATGVGLLGYTHAKETLIAAGMDRQRVEKMSVGQVLALYSERHYQRFADDWEKNWSVPYPEMVNRTETFEQRLAAANLFGGGKDREVLPIVSVFMPAQLAARAAQVRLERQIAALRIIEAIRLYAASHDGQLPQRLQDIEELPIPSNPATGQPFAYRLENATAVLELPASDRILSGNARYEIQIQSTMK